MGSERHPRTSRNGRQSLSRVGLSCGVSAEKQYRANWAKRRKKRKNRDEEGCAERELQTIEATAAEEEKGPDAGIGNSLSLAPTISVSPSKRDGDSNHVWLGTECEEHLVDGKDSIYQADQQEGEALALNTHKQRLPFENSNHAVLLSKTVKLPSYLDTNQIAPTLRGIDGPQEGCDDPILSVSSASTQKSNDLKTANRWSFNKRIKVDTESTVWHRNDDDTDKERHQIADFRDYLAESFDFVGDDGISKNSRNSKYLPCGNVVINFEFKSAREDIPSLKKLDLAEYYAIGPRDSRHDQMFSPHKCSWRSTPSALLESEKQFDPCEALTEDHHDNQSTHSGIVTMKPQNEQVSMALEAEDRFEGETRGHKLQIRDQKRVVIAAEMEVQELLEQEHNKSIIRNQNLSPRICDGRIEALMADKVVSKLLRHRQPTDSQDVYRLDGLVRKHGNEEHPLDLRLANCHSKTSEFLVGSQSSILRKDKKDVKLRKASNETTPRNMAITPLRSNPAAVESSFSVDASDYLPSVLVMNGIGQLDADSIFPKRLYPWQAQCLRKHPGILEGTKNVIISAPTSSGKTAIAEVLLLRAVERGAKGMFILPYVTLCEQEADRLEKLLKPFRKDVRRAYGSEYSIGRLGPTAGIVVATPEQASAIVCKYLSDHINASTKSFHEIFSCVVVDEVHMIGEKGRRGCELELLLTKLRMVAEDALTNAAEGGNHGADVACLTGNTYQMESKTNKNSSLHFQMVAMSATLPNVKELADWLQAVPYCTDFRPVPLRRWLKNGCNIVDTDGKLVRELPSPEPDDPDHIAYLCKESVSCGNSVLIFCPTKNSLKFSKIKHSCQDEAWHLSSVFASWHVNSSDVMRLGNRYLWKPQRITDGNVAAEHAPSTSNKNDLMSARAELVSALQSCEGIHAEILSKIVMSGVAYHHADLSKRARELIERAFISGILSVLCATSTLAAGVNLPAHRVIFRSPKVGSEYLDVTKYVQMAGRAGRKGIDDEGEAILISPAALEKVDKLLANKLESLIRANIPPVASQLIEENMAIRGALDAIAVKPEGASATDINRFVMSTLGGHLHYDDMVKAVQKGLKDLGKYGMAIFDRKTDRYFTTPLGDATFLSSCSPSEAVEISKDIEKACKCWTLGNDLYPSFLLIPPHQDIAISMTSEQYRKLNILLESCDEEDIQVLVSIGGGDRSTLDHAIVFGQQGRFKEIEKSMARTCRRLYLAFMLRSLVNEMDHDEISEQYAVNSIPVIEGLQDSAARYVGRLKAFCGALGRGELKEHLDKFVKRTMHGVKDELLPLLPLCEINRWSKKTKTLLARTLHGAGLISIEHVAAASVAEIAASLNQASNQLLKRQSSTKLAEKLKQQALQLKRLQAERAQQQLEKCEQGQVPVSAGSDPLSALYSPTESTTSVDLADDDVEVSGAVQICGTKHNSNDRQNQKRIISSNEQDSDPTDRQNNEGGESKEVIDTDHDSLQPLKAASKQIVNEIYSIHSEPMKSSVSKLPLACCVSFKDNLPGDVEIGSSVDSFSLEKQRFHWIGTIPAFHSLLEILRSRTRFGIQFHYDKDALMHPFGDGELLGVAIAWEPDFQAYIPCSVCSTKDIPLDHAFSDYVLDQLAQLLRSSSLEVVYKDFKPQVAITRRLCEGTLHRHCYQDNTLNRESEAIDLLQSTLIDARVADWLANKTSSDLKIVPIPMEELPKDVSADLVHACKNAALALKVYLNCSPFTEKLNLTPLLCNLEMPLVPVLADMERNGIGLHVPSLEHCRDTLIRRLAELPDRVLAAVGSSNIDAYEVNRTRNYPSIKYKLNLDSQKHVRALLFHVLQLKPPPLAIVRKKNAAGETVEKISTKKDVLELLRDMHPSVGMIIEYRSLRKILGDVDGYLMYARSMKKKMNASSDERRHQHWRHGDGASSIGVQKIHAIFYQTESDTGRLTTGRDDEFGNGASVRGGIPSLQCMAKSFTVKLQSLQACERREVETTSPSSSDTVVTVNIRASIVPLRSDGVFLSADFCHNELRIMAHLSGDATLIRLLQDEAEDPFCMLAATFFQIDCERVTIKERNQAKQLCYALMYGMGSGRLADVLKITIEEAEVMKNNFLAQFPGLRDWMDEELNKCRSSGYITTIHGRKRWLPHINNEVDGKARASAERAAINSIVQGSAADLCKKAMIDIHRHLLQGDSSLGLPPHAGNLVLQIHDELLIEVERAFLQSAALVVRRCMQHAMPLQVPIKVKLTFGTSWGEMDEL